MTLGLLESYNRTRYVDELLERTEDKAPSLTIHLHPEHWVLNNGSKFLYHNQMASLLDDIRAHRIPVDFLDLFDDARVPFYDGCMVVELLDYRAKRSKDPQPEKPDRTRVILHPNSETMYADICALNAKSKSNWSDRDALEIESKLLLATAPPLCLDPTPHLSRIANHVLRASTPTVPMSLKRKASNHEPEEDETEKTRRAKIMAFMAPRNTRQHAPNYTFYENFVKHKHEKYMQDHEPPKHPPPNYLNGPPIRPPPKPPTPAPVPPMTHAPVQIDNQRHIIYNVAPDNAQATYPTPQYSTVPTNGQPTHQFVSQASPTAPGITPQVYRNVQEATAAAATAQRATAGTPVSNNGAQMTAHQQQLQMLQKAQMQSQTSLSLGGGAQKMPAGNPPPQSAGSPPVTVQPPSAISPSTSSNPAYAQPTNHYPNQQQTIQRPASVAPTQIAMSNSNQSQPSGGPVQPSAVAPPAPPPISTTPSTSNPAAAAAAARQNPAILIQQLKVNALKAHQAYLVAQNNFQANPNDPEIRKVLTVAQATALQEKGKLDTLMARLNQMRNQQMQQQQAQAQAANGGGGGGQATGASQQNMNVTGRVTPLNLVAAGSQGGNGGQQPSSAPTPSPARASPMPGAQGLPMQQQPHYPQQQQQPQNSTMQQQQHMHRTMTPAQGQPQPQQTLQVPNVSQPGQQGQQPQIPGGGGQFTFAAPYNPAAAARTATPTNVAPGQYTFAVSQGNVAGRVNAGTPVPGVGVANAQRSPQQIQAQQQHAQQQAQAQAQQQHAQQQQAQHQQAVMQQQQQQAAMAQQMRTPQMQNSQLRTPQTQAQALRTPQMGNSQLRTPQQAQAQMRTPQMQPQQIQGGGVRQGTPQQNMSASVQAAMQAQGGPTAQQAQQMQAQMALQQQQQYAQQGGQGQMNQMTPTQQYQMQQYYQYQYQQQQQQQQQAQAQAQAQPGLVGGQGQAGAGGLTQAQMQHAAHLQRVQSLTPQQQQVYWAHLRQTQAQAQAQAQGLMAGGQGPMGVQGGQGAVMGGVAIGGVPQSAHQFSLSVGGGQGIQGQAAVIAAANAAKMKQQQQQQGR